MTKEKFDLLCKQVLVPKLGDLMHAQLATLHETLDIIAGTLARIEQNLNSD
jgi:hypothetical protein